MSNYQICGHCWLSANPLRLPEWESQQQHTGPCSGQRCVFILHCIPQTFGEGACADLPTLGQASLLGKSMGKFLFPGRGM